MAPIPRNSTGFPLESEMENCRFERAWGLAGGGAFLDSCPEAGLDVFHTNLGDVYSLEILACGLISCDVSLED